MAFILHGGDEVILFHIQNVSLLSSKGAEIQCRCDIHYILDLKVRIESCDCHMMWISPFFLFVCCCFFADSADAWCGCGRDCGDIGRGSQHSEYWMWRVTSVSLLVIVALMYVGEGV